MLVPAVPAVLVLVLVYFIVAVPMAVVMPALHTVVHKSCTRLCVTSWQLVLHAHHSTPPLAPRPASASAVRGSPERRLQSHRQRMRDHVGELRCAHDAAR